MRVAEALGISLHGVVLIFVHVQSHSHAILVDPSLVHVRVMLVNLVSVRLIECLVG